MSIFVTGNARACNKLCNFVISSSRKDLKPLLVSSRFYVGAAAARKTRRYPFKVISGRGALLSSSLSTRFCNSSSSTNELDASQICWNCKTDLSNSCNPLLMCFKCNSLRHPPENLCYFDLFGLTRIFKMDLRNLARKHKDMQRVLHPDRFTLASEEEKLLSETWSPLVNEGYATLKKPIKRANYLLLLAGKPLTEKDELVHNPNFLAEIVELNEEILEADSQADTSGILQDVCQTLQRYYDNVEKAFDQNDIAKARLITAEMRYYENLKKKIVDRETELGVVR